MKVSKLIVFLISSFTLYLPCLSSNITYRVWSVHGPLNEIIVDHKLEGKITFSSNYRTATISGFCNTLNCNQNGCWGAKRACTNGSNQIDSYLSQLLKGYISYVIKTNRYPRNPYQTNRIAYHGKYAFFKTMTPLTYRMKSIDNDHMNNLFKQSGKTVDVRYDPYREEFILRGLCNYTRCYKGQDSCISTRRSCGSNIDSIENFIKPILLKYLSEKTPDRETDEIGHGDDEIKVVFYGAY